MQVLKIILCCLRKCFCIKKKKQGDKLPAIFQLPTGAIKSRVNLPGFPWINQELSQGLTGQGEGIGRAPPPPRGLQHRSAARWGMPTERKQAITQITELSRLLPQAQKAQPCSHISRVPAYHAQSSISKEWTQWVVFYKVGFFFGPEWNVNVYSSFFLI